MPQLNFIMILLLHLILSSDIQFSVCLVKHTTVQRRLSYGKTIIKTTLLTPDGIAA